MLKLRDNKRKLGWFGILYGKPGTGKTSLFAYTKGILYCGNEKNNDFKDIASLNPVSNWIDFSQQLNDILQDGMKGYHTLVIDNMSDLEAMYIKYFCKDKNLTTYGGGYGAGYVQIEKKMRAILDGCFKPLQELGKNIILICHAKEKSMSDLELEIEFDQYVPFLEAKTLRPFEAHANWIFHLHRPYNPKSKVSPRVLITEYNLAHLAKKKSDINLPNKAVIENIKVAWNKILTMSGLGSDKPAEPAPKSKPAEPVAKPKPVVKPKPTPAPAKPEPVAKPKPAPAPAKPEPVAKPAPKPKPAPAPKSKSEPETANMVSNELKELYDKCIKQMELPELDELLKRYNGNEENLIKNIKEFLNM